MSHPCPDCQQECYCDIEDIGWDEAPDDCCHECDEETDDQDDHPCKMNGQPCDCPGDLIWKAAELDGLKGWRRDEI